jgi:hypothetical protein
VPDPHGPYGAKGLGEHVLIPTAPAILNAITRCNRCRVRHLPATPRKVLRRHPGGRHRMAEPCAKGDKIRCDACPVMCYIARAGPAPATATPMKAASWSASTR